MEREMIRVNIFTNEDGSEDGEGVDRGKPVAVFEVRGQELDVIEGSARFIRVGMPVYSERYGRPIDFDTDGEEWARMLPSAYGEGEVSATVEEIVEPVSPPWAVRPTWSPSPVALEKPYRIR
jgi:hypothetical protein